MRYLCYLGIIFAIFFTIYIFMQIKKSYLIVKNWRSMVCINSQSYFVENRRSECKNGSHYYYIHIKSEDQKYKDIKSVSQEEYKKLKEGDLYGNCSVYTVPQNQRAFLIVEEGRDLESEKKGESMMMYVYVIFLFIVNAGIAVMCRAFW